MSRLHYYDYDYEYIPMTKTDFNKVGSRWIVSKEEKKLISRRQSENVLSKIGLPFARSNRLTKTDMRTSNLVDTFSSISPDGKNKTTWFVDFYSGGRNYIRNAKRAYSRKQYYKKTGK